MRVLILRLEAPLMSFGGVIVDNHGRTGAAPLRSMMTGLLGNALGYAHRDADALSQLQERLLLASRRDRAGEPLVDFHTVDLGQEHLAIPGWTTDGVARERGGASSKRTHIRYRHYWADAVTTVVVGLTAGPPDGVALEQLDVALRTPARPLFLGRKTCLPSGSILVGSLDVDSLFEALQKWPRAVRADSGPLAASWPADEEGDAPSQMVPTYEDRDWRNQIHTGRRLVRQGLVNPTEREAS